MHTACILQITNIQMGRMSTFTHNCFYCALILSQCMYNCNSNVLSWRFLFVRNQVFSAWLVLRLLFYYIIINFLVHLSHKHVWNFRIPFLYICLLEHIWLLQNHWTIFSQTWHIATYSSLLFISQCVAIEAFCLSHALPTILSILDCLEFNIHVM